jgi:kynurenine formamidase
VIDRLGLPADAKGFTVERDDTSSNGAQPTGPVDLTHVIREGMTTFPGLNHPRVEITQLARHGVEGRATRRLVLGTHTGTHVDAPLHFIPGADDVDALGLDALVGPAQVADLTPVEPLEEIGVDRLRSALGGTLRQPRLLLRYDWSERFGSLAFYTESPYLSREACHWLVEQGARLIGMDTPSPDDPRLGFGSAEDSPNHHILLGAGVVLVEYLANLAAVRTPEPLLVVAPLRVLGADGAPARVFALPR